MADGGAGTIAMGGSCLSGRLVSDPGSSGCRQRSSCRLRGCSGFFGGLQQRLWEDALAPGQVSLLACLFPQREEQELQGSESPGIMSCDPVFMDGLESSWVLSGQWCIPHLWFLPP